MRKMITGEQLDAALNDAAARGPGTYYADQLEWYGFPETWPSTALGFGGMGGAAMTTATTLIVITDNRDAQVYFGGRWAYTVDRAQAMEFVKARRCLSRKDLAAGRGQDELASTGGGE